MRTAADVRVAKAIIARAGKDIPVIAKLEKPEAIENLDEILSVADGVMVARGDLGVEMSLEKVPVVQKQIIARARDALVPVIHGSADARFPAGRTREACARRGAFRRRECHFSTEATR